MQESTLKGLDGLAPAGTVAPLLRHRYDPPYFILSPRLGVAMNPYTTAPVVRQLFVTEPFNNTIAVIDLVVFGTAPNQVFGLAPGPIVRLGPASLNQPVDLAPAKIDIDNPNWASNTSMDEGSDLYVANRGDNTIVRLHQDGSVAGALRVNLRGNSRLNGIATSPDGTQIYATFLGPGPEHGGVLALPAFGG